MTLEDANAIRILLAKRIVPRDAEEGFALLQLADKMYTFVAEHQLCVPPSVPDPAVQVAGTNGK
jgi:hypothetical protein